MDGILSLELVFIILSVIIAGYSYKGQKQSQMRESLEQLDHTNLSSTHKLAILLHGYSFVPRRTKLNFRVYYTPFTGGQGSTAEQPFQRLSDEEQGQFLETVRNMGGGGLSEVSDVDIREYDLVITVDSIDPVNVRRVADEIGLAFNEEFAENF